jgi:predicted nucleic acid-binding protein
MPKTKLILDTNVILRFITQDHPVHSPAAESLLRLADAREVELVLEPWVVAEVVFTLESFYELDRQSIAESVLALLSLPGVLTARGMVVRDATKRYRSTTVSFVDALLAATAVAEGLPVASFDRDFKKFPDVERYEPK